ncbi:MAG: hypothetical protein KatS3mg102_1221 [Planctomycetota bacterium]|nr:MAG: hypothetical protein KatS3mg102_1221 [Planctomycetota bacterium]
MRRRLHVRAVRAALLAALAAASPAAATNGAKPIADGARAQGRGGVDVALAEDATAIASNPAGLAFIDGQRVDQTLGLILPRVQWRGPTDRDRNREPWLPVGSFGFVFDFQEPWHLDEVLTFRDEARSELPSRLQASYAGSPFKFGFGIFPVKGGNVRLNFTTPFWDADPDAGLDRQRPRYQTISQEVGIHLALGYRLSEKLAFGLSPSFVLSRLEVDQPLAQPTSILKGHPVGTSGLTYADVAPFQGIEQIEGLSDLDGASTFGFRVKLGVLWHVNETVSLGLTYAPPSYTLDYLGRVAVDLNRMVAKVDPQGTLLKPVVAANTGIPPEDQDYRGAYNVRLKPFAVPQEVAVGIAVRLPRLTLGLDLRWLQWSQANEEFRAELTDGTSPELNELTGDGSGRTQAEVPLDWEDQLVVAVGAAVAVTDWLVLRAGYNWANNPVPDETLQPTLPAIFTHHLTGGFSLWWRRLELSGAVEWALPVEQRTARNLANRSYDGTEVEAELFWFSLGIGASF